MIVYHQQSVLIIVLNDMLCYAYIEMKLRLAVVWYLEDLKVVAIIFR